MFKKLALTLAAFLLLAIPVLAQAGEGHGNDCASCHKLEIKDAQELVKKLGATVKSVKQAPAKGFFELLMEKDGRQGVLFMDYAKKHIMQGAMFSLDSLQPVVSHMQELAQAQPKQATNIDVKSIPSNGSFVMGNPKGSKKLYVFTDPDCPFCRKFHTELQQLVKIMPDVAVNIVLYPLPMHPAAYDKARAVLEANSREVLDKAFEGKDVPKPAKESSKALIEANIKFANEHGISGTPTLVLPDGTVVVGGRDADTLKQILQGK